jgi:hypothetical protein
MTTQYTSILKLALPVQGELSGTWGDVVNDNITSMVEQAIAGRAVINSWTGNSHTLTTANGTTSESRCAMLEFTDTGAQLSGAGTVVCPALSKIYIAKNAAGQNVTLKTASGTGILVPNGRTMFLFCDGTNVVEAVTSTTSLQLGTSTTVTAVLDEDNMASNSATSLATQQSIKAYVDAQVGSFDTLAEVLAQGNTTGGTDIAVGTGDDITFADSSKAIFGAGSDLQIYHDGSNSYIDETATGHLFIRSNGDGIYLRSSTNEELAHFNVNGSVKAYYDNSLKFETTATGIDVTGTATMDGLEIATTASDTGVELTLNGNKSSNGGVGSIIFENAGDSVGMIRSNRASANDAADMLFYTQATGGANAERMRISSSGSVGIGNTVASSMDGGANNLVIGSGSGTEGMTIYSGTTNSGTIYFADGSSGDDRFRGQINYAHSDNSLNFRTNASSSPQMTLDSSGNVGIGTSSPSTKLHLGGTAPLDSIIRQDSTVSGTNWEIGERAAGKWQIWEDDSDSVVATFMSSGNVGIGNSSPSANLEITQSGNNVGLLVAGGGYNYTAKFESSDAEANIIIEDSNSTNDGNMIGVVTNDMYFITNTAERMRIDSSGTMLLGTSSVISGAGGTGAQLFLKQSANSNGISSVANSNDNYIRMLHTGTEGKIETTYGSGSYTPLVFYTTGTERMRIDSAGTATFTKSGGGNIRIAETASRYVEIFGYAEGTANGSTMAFHTIESGTSTSTERMRINSAGAISVGSSTQAVTELQLNHENSGGKGEIQLNSHGTASFSMLSNFTGGTVSGVATGGFGLTTPHSYPISIVTNDLERLRVDSAGNLLVGKTANDNTTVGGSIRAGESTFTAGNSRALTVGRNTNDGELIQFRKGTGSVGTIGTTNSFFVGQGDSGLGFFATDNLIFPADPTNVVRRDNAIDLGYSAGRFDDIYATNGTIQTSDRNEKQDIAELSDAEQRVAVAAKGLLRKFRWKDSVAEKGDEARTHFGIIAQDLQAAFAAEGLDAGDYAMFISSTWTDEETNEEKTRMGVRYSELLAFIIAAI